MTRSLPAAPRGGRAPATPVVSSGASRAAWVAAALLVAAAAAESPVEAYIGPGAGFALLSSFLVVFTTLILAFVTLLTWPFRAAWRMIRRPKRLSKPWVRRLIIVGFDGQDPKLTEKFMAEGKLPNYQRLAEMGHYGPLQTAAPSVSPVAWSSFATGTNPAKHNIFDFLDRDPRSYLPVLSSTHIGGVEKFLKVGKYRIPLKKPDIRLLRKSRPYWSILGDHTLWSTVLRVPITFPPDRFYGAQLSAMCVPDLLGTQGTFLLYTTRPSEEKFKEGGLRFTLKTNGAGTDRFETTVTGPENMFLEGNPPLSIPMTIDVDRKKRTARVSIDGSTVELQEGRLSEWQTLTFKAAPMIKVTGLTRLMITEMDEHFSLYMSPINIDPERPAMPISHPSYYSTYLAKRVGPFSTLGLAEDTWGLNEKVIDDGTFLKLAYDIDRERQDMFFSALDRLRRGSMVCVFDATDRIQHMFWRYIEDGHPAARGIDNPEHKNAIEEIYRHNDVLVGKVLDKVKPDDVLIVLSDHGFTSFRRGVNLNAWLKENGYLVLKDGADGRAEWLQDVDWSRTKAYALGLTGLFLNVEGREAQGIVKPGEEAEALKREIAGRLKGLRDEACDDTGIREAFDTNEIYSGPYTGNAPDLLIGYDEGYRVSWDCATGVVAGPVFEDNEKAWSGDHCVDPRLVPGVVFSSHEIAREKPSLVDIAPTALRLFGVAPPEWMEGECLFEESAIRSKKAGGKTASAAKAAAL